MQLLQRVTQLLPVMLQHLCLGLGLLAGVVVRYTGLWRDLLQWLLLLRGLGYFCACGDWLALWTRARSDGG